MIWYEEPDDAVFCDAWELLRLWEDEADMAGGWRRSRSRKREEKLKEAKQ